MLNRPCSRWRPCSPPSRGFCLRSRAAWKCCCWCRCSIRWDSTAVTAANRRPPTRFAKKNAAAGQRPDSARHSVGMCARSRSGRAGMVPATGNRSTPSERVWRTRGILMQESDCALAPPVQIRPQSVPRGDDRRLGRLYRPANPHGELVTRFYHKFLFGKIFAEKNHFFYGWRSWRPRLHQLTKKQIVPIGWSQGPRPSPGSDVQSSAACGTSLWPPGPDQPP